MPDVIYGVNWNGTEKVNYTYDSLGRLTNKNVNSVLNNNYSYIDVNSTKTTTLLSSLSTVAGTYSYTYDELGNITSINDGTYTTSYEYDDLNQLVRENDQKAGVTYTYEYSNGNITSKKEYAYTTGDLGSLQDTITWNYADSTWGDLLTSFDGKSITYDAIGNPVTYGNYTINWNGRRLESINLNDTEVLSYSYNIDGQRVSKTYEGITTQCFYNGDILAGEKTGNNVIIYMYDNNGDIFGFTYNGTEYYYIKNAQNDVVAIADASGNVVVMYYYNAWGEIIDCVDNTTFELSSINPITYRSYYNDNIVGMDMYYLNSRYYMADWGRFVSADSYVQTGQGMLDKNMFAYCANNPVMFCDPSGCSYEITIPAVGNGPVTVTTGNGKTYSYNIPKKGNTYYFDEKQFKKDLINNKVTQIDKKVTQVLEPIVQVTGESFADAMINSTLNAINSANLTYLIPYGHELNAVSSGFGLASLASVGLQVVWDYENYGNDWKSYSIASLITITSFGLTIGAGLLIASCNPAAIVGVAMAICAGVAISTGAELAREELLP